MAAPKGHRIPNAPRGRKGPNKNTAAIRDMILGALDAKGGQAYLERQADANPVAFMGLIAKVMPMQITGSDDPNAPALRIALEYVNAKN